MLPAKETVTLYVPAGKRLAGTVNWPSAIATELLVYTVLPLSSLMTTLTLPVTALGSILKLTVSSEPTVIFWGDTVIVVSTGSKIVTLRVLLEDQ